MEEEKKSIRFLKSHTLSFRGKTLDFRRDDVAEVGTGEIDEKTAKELIRMGIALPGVQFGAPIKQEWS